MRVISKLTQAIYAVIISFVAASRVLAGDPGSLPSSSSAISDQLAGSVLVYNYYTSDASAGTGNPGYNTKFSITNTSSTLPAFVHIFFVSESCSPADYHLCLSPNMTSSHLVSELDPGINGYIVVIAEDGNTGWPVSHNFLTGDEYMRFPSGQNTISATLNAEAFSAIFSGRMPGFNPTVAAAVLNFSGESSGYNRAPAVLALSNLPSRADQNETMIIINRFGGNLTDSAFSLPRLTGLLYDDKETSFSFSLAPGSCQKKLILTDQEPRTAPRLSAIIPARRSGWMKLSVQSGDAAILGSMINSNPNSLSQADVFNGGHNLHKLSLTRVSVAVTIPVFPTGCD